MFIAVTSYKPPNVEPVHCDLLICGQGTMTVGYIHSVGLTQFMVPGMEITKSQYTMVFLHLHVEKAVCMIITWHKQ